MFPQCQHIHLSLPVTVTPSSTSIPIQVMLQVLGKPEPLPCLTMTWWRIASVQTGRQESTGYAVIQSISGTQRTLHLLQRGLGQSTYMQGQRITNH